MLSVEELIIDACVRMRANVFIQGSGGTGKSCLIRKIASLLEKKHLIISVTASTGSAAINVKGTTLHRFAGIGLGNLDADELFQKVIRSRTATSRWMATKVLIIDEISMIGAGLFEKLDYIARRITLVDKPFGGIQLIVSGDMLQLPPIKDNWIFTCDVWKKLDFTIYTLKIPKRYDDLDYFKMLLRIRRGEHTEDDIDVLLTRLKEYSNIKKLMESSSTDETMIKPTILYSYRADVDQYNYTELSKLNHQQIHFTSIDVISSKLGKQISDEQKTFYTNLLNDAIPEKLILKVGAQVMLRKNLDVESGLVNGSRGVVVEILETESLVNVKFLNGIIMSIGREDWEVEDTEVFACRSQIPLILAWSYTIHKSQGATLDCAVCDLGKSVFANSQAYVALSRVKNLKSLYLSNFDPNSIRTDYEALEYVNSIDETPVKLVEGLVFVD